MNRNFTIFTIPSDEIARQKQLELEIKNSEEKRRKQESEKTKESSKA